MRVALKWSGLPLWRVVPGVLVLVWCCTSALAGTNQVRVGLLPFANLTGQTNLDVWSRGFPQRLAFELDQVTPARLQVYFTKVLKELTNSGWDGRQAVGPELRAKVARELRLEKLVSGSFKRDERGWEVEVQILEAGSSGKAQVHAFKEASTYRLLMAMPEKTLAALGVKPNPAFHEALTKRPVSNSVMDKVASLEAAQEAGAPKEQMIKDLRAVLAAEPASLEARTLLIATLYEAERQEEGLAEARKLVELAPEICWGHVSVADCTKQGTPGGNEQIERALLQALKVHPGCRSAAGMLFPAWATQGRWKELKPLAEKAHEAQPDEVVPAAALAGALAAEGDLDSARKLFDEIGPVDDDDPNAHALLLQASLGVKSMMVLSREMLWLQQRSATNDYVRNLMSQVDATFWLWYPPESTPTNPPPRLYSPEQLLAELAKRLTPEEVALVENPLLVTEPIRARARALTSGLTNATSQATVLFASVIEERLKTEQQATNSAKPDRLPVCHQYASRLVSLARGIGLPAWLVHVEFASEEYTGYHDCAAIQLARDNIIQFDPTLATLGDPEDKYRILDDLQAIAHHLLQEEDLARLRVAQKFDPDDPWTRTMVILRLAQLDQLDEAEQLWKGLGPAFTNRWDYYLSRGQIEIRRRHYASALDWLNRAAVLATNNPTIHCGLGMAYSALHEDAKAAEHLERAAKLGAARENPKRRAELESNIKLSRALADARDLSEPQLRERVAAGDLPAQMLLANALLQRGEVEEALKLLLDGAKKGDPTFQRNYGKLLYTVKPSAAPEAVEWLRKAATQDPPQGCYLLAKLLYEGTNVPKDEIEASQWAHVGDAHGDKDCRGLLKEMQLFADPAALAEGKRRAQAILSKSGG
jgi:thioredoxin-like negative regulator of GroEL